MKRTIAFLCIAAAMAIMEVTGYHIGYKAGFTDARLKIDNKLGDAYWTSNNHVILHGTCIVVDRSLAASMVEMSECVKAGAQ